MLRVRRRVGMLRVRRRVEILRVRRRVEILRVRRRVGSRRVLHSELLNESDTATVAQNEVFPREYFNL